MDEKRRAEFERLLSEIRHGEGPPHKSANAEQVQFDRGYALACKEIRVRLESILLVETNEEDSDGRDVPLG